MTATSFEIERAIRRMAITMRRRIFQEQLDHLKAHAVFYRNEGKSELETEVLLLQMVLGIARTNRSGWSGGHSSGNMAEQERREVALSDGEDMVRTVLRETFR